jgi:ribonuclease HI
MNLHHLRIEGEDIPDSELYGAGDPIAAIFADGGVFGSSDPTLRSRSYIGGVWAWCHVTRKSIALAERSGLLLPTATVPTITNNYAEYVAAVRALEALPEGAHVQVCLDSEITIGRLFYKWACSGIPDKLRYRGERAVARLGSARPILLDGHPTRAQLAAGRGSRGYPVSRHNVWCDTACNREKDKYLALLQEERDKNGRIDN